MRKKFVTNLALLIFLNLLVKPFWMFGIDREVQNTVGSEQYGFYFALFNFSLILNILLDFGITNFNNRNIAQNSQLLNKHFSNIITIRILLSLGYFAVSLVAAMAMGFLWSEIKLLLFLLFNQFLLSFILYLRSNIAGLHLFKTDSFLSVLDRLLMIGICSALLWTNIAGEEFKIKWFVFAQTAAYSTSALVAFIIVLTKSGRIRIRFDKTFTLALLKKSYPYAILALLMGFYNRFDAVLIERLLPKTGKMEAGIYAQGFRILDGANQFALLFASLLLPIFSKMLKQKEPIGKMVKMSYILVVLPAIAIAMSCIFFRVEIIDLLYHEHVEYSASLFSIIILGFIAVSTTYIFGTLLTANGSLKQLNIMAAVGMALSLTLNLILIPKFAAKGAAITSLTIQSFTALVQAFIAFKIFKLKVNYKLIFLLLIFAAGVYAFGILSLHLPYQWFIRMGIMLILSGIFAFAIGLLKVKSILQILKSET